MTHDDKVKRAVEIIFKCNPADVAAELFRVEEFCERRDRRLASPKKVVSKAAESFRAALARVRSVAKNLPPALRLPPLFPGFAERENPFVGHGYFLDVIERMIATCETYEIAKKYPRSLKRDAHDKVMAAQAAFNLLKLYSLPIATTRKGKFCTLAAVLHGDEKADLFNQCRAVKNLAGC